MRVSFSSNHRQNKIEWLHTKSLKKKNPAMQQGIWGNGKNIHFWKADYRAEITNYSILEI